MCVYAVCYVLAVAVRCNTVTRYEFPEHQNVLCMEVVNLRCDSEGGDLKSFVAIGAANIQGEDVACRGNVCPPQSLFQSFNLRIAF